MAYTIRDTYAYNYTTLIQTTRKDKQGNTYTAVTLYCMETGSKKTFVTPYMSNALPSGGIRTLVIQTTISAREYSAVSSNAEHVDRVLASHYENLTYRS